MWPLIAHSWVPHRPCPQLKGVALLRPHPSLGWSLFELVMCISCLIWGPHWRTTPALQHPTKASPDIAPLFLPLPKPGPLTSSQVLWEPSPKKTICIQISIPESVFLSHPSTLYSQHNSCCEIRQVFTPLLRALQWLPSHQNRAIYTLVALLLDFASFSSALDHTSDTGFLAVPQTYQACSCLGAFARALLASWNAPFPVICITPSLTSF